MMQLRWTNSGYRFFSSDPDRTEEVNEVVLDLLRLGEKHGSSIVSAETREQIKENIKSAFESAKAKR